MSFSKPNRAHTFNGILFVSLFALSSLYLAEISWIAHSGISALVIAIILGIIYSNTLRHKLPSEWTPGIHFAGKQLLRLAIILYGFRVTFQQVISIGLTGLLLDSAIVASTLMLGYIVGVKVFKLDRHLALLVSTGSAVCGAAAVLAAEDVLKSQAYKATIAVGTVVLFGTIAMFLYPALQKSGLLGLTDIQFGVFAGASVHEVAQALVAGTNVSSAAGNVAVIVKMTRVLMLVPVLILLSISERRAAAAQNPQRTRIAIPWFAILFAGVIGFNSLNLLASSVILLINQLDLFLLTMAMAAIGMETHFSKIRQVGFPPLYLSTLLFVWLTGMTFLLVKLFSD